MRRFVRYRSSRSRFAGRRRQAGVTLVEALVAIAILAIVTSLIWGGYAQTARNKERVETDLDRHHTVQSALNRMTRELSMAYVSAQLNPSPSMQTVQTAFVGTDRSRGDRLDFCTFAHRRLIRDSHIGDQAEVSYFLTDHPEGGRRKVLARREQPRPDDRPDRGGRVQMLIEDVEDLQFEYLDPLSGEWVQRWDTTQAAGQPNRLPSQVKITLTIPHPHIRGRNVTYGTRVAVPIRFALNHAIYNP